MADKQYWMDVVLSDGTTQNVPFFVPIPEKGADYYTEADQESILQQVIAALGTPVFGRVDADKKIILTGDNLADGTYTFVLERKDGNGGLIGTATIAPEPTYTNLFNPDTAVLNTRMSGSSQTSKAQDGYVMTATIPIPATSITGTTAGTAYIAVPASMWTGSANMFTNKNGVTNGYAAASGTPGTVSGDWVKIPLIDEWGQSFTTDGVILSLYVKSSAITKADIQNLQIYFNECPE